MIALGVTFLHRQAAPLTLAQLDRVGHLLGGDACPTYPEPYDSQLYRGDWDSPDGLAEVRELIRERLIHIPTNIDKIKTVIRITNMVVDLLSMQTTEEELARALCIKTLRELLHCISVDCDHLGSNIHYTANLLQKLKGNIELISDPHKKFNNEEWDPEVRLINQAKNAIQAGLNYLIEQVGRDENTPYEIESQSQDSSPSPLPEDDDQVISLHTVKEFLSILDGDIPLNRFRLSVTLLEISDAVERKSHDEFCSDEVDELVEELNLIRELIEDSLNPIENYRSRLKASVQAAYTFLSSSS